LSLGIQLWLLSSQLALSFPRTLLEAEVGKAQQQEADTEQPMIQVGRLPMAGCQMT
jgi:hypothetical protein